MAVTLKTNVSGRNVISRLNTLKEWKSHYDMSLVADFLIGEAVGITENKLDERRMLV
jgi:hypothetical protein